ncbi:hypothetical protein D3C81_1114320 [compost metagenome]
MLVVLGHLGGRAEHRNPRLAYRHDMRAGAEVSHELLEVVDIIAKVEAAGAERDQARIGPVGDVDIMPGQQCFDRRAQQRGVVARERRHQQHAGTGAWHVLGEMQQPAEGRLDQHGLRDRHPLSARDDLVDGEARFPVGPGQPDAQIKRGAGLAHPWQPRDGVAPEIDGTLTRFDHGPERPDRLQREFTQSIERHGNPCLLKNWLLVVPRPAPASRAWPLAGAMPRTLQRTGCAGQRQDRLRSRWTGGRWSAVRCRARPRCRRCRIAWARIACVLPGRLVRLLRPDASVPLRLHANRLECCMTSPLLRATDVALQSRRNNMHLSYVIYIQ